MIKKTPFSGYIISTNLLGEFIRGYRYENNLPKGQVVNWSVRNGRVGDVIETCEITDWYSCPGYATQVNNDCSFMYSTYSCTTTYVGGGGGGGSYAYDYLGIIGGGSTTFSGYFSLETILANPVISEFFEELTPQERRFFRDNPGRLPQALANKRASESLVTAYYCRNDDNGNWNAFKHATWSAWNARSWGANAARELGLAHEQGGQNNQRQMDLWNNDVGINIAQSNPNEYGPGLVQLILDAVDSGQCRRLNNWQDNNSVVIPTNNQDKCF